MYWYLNFFKFIFNNSPLWNNAIILLLVRYIIVSDEFIYLDVSHGLLVNGKSADWLQCTLYILKDTYSLTL